MADPMSYHLCPVCKKPMKRVETENYGPGWVFDCKCLDAATRIEGGVMVCNRCGFALITNDPHECFHIDRGGVE